MRYFKRSLLRLLVISALLMLLLSVLLAYVGWHGLRSVAEGIERDRADGHQKIQLLDGMEHLLDDLHEVTVSEYHRRLPAVLTGRSQSALEPSAVPSAQIFRLMQQINQHWLQYWQMTQWPEEWPLAKRIDVDYRSCLQQTQRSWNEAQRQPSEIGALWLINSVGSQCHQVSQELNQLSELNHQLLLRAEQEAQRHIRGRQLGMLGLAGLLLLFSVVFFLWMLRSWLQRFQRLQWVVEALDCGTLVTPLPSDAANDEVGQMLTRLLRLHQRFSRLINQLRKRQQRSLLLSRRYALRSGINQLLLHANCPSVLLENFAQLIIDAGEFGFIWCGTLEHGQLQTLVWKNRTADRHSSSVLPEAVAHWLLANATTLLGSGRESRVCGLHELTEESACHSLLAALGEDLRVCGSFSVPWTGEKNIRWLLMAREAGALDAGQRTACERIAEELGFVQRIFQEREIQRATQWQLQQQEQILEQAQQVAHLGTWYQKAGADALTLSREARRLFALPEDLTEMTLGFLISRVHPGERGRVEQRWLKAVGTAEQAPVEFRVLLPEGAPERWLALTQHEIRQGGGSDFLGTLQDISERRLREEKLLLFSLAIEQTMSTVVITDLDMNIQYVNRSFERTTGYSPAEALGQTPRMFKSGKTPEAVYEQLFSQLQEGKSWRGTFTNRRKEGAEYIEEVRISPVRQEDGRLTHYMAVKEDVTEQHQLHEQMQLLAYRDALTELPNRRWFMQHLEQAVQQSRQEHSGLTLFFIDLNRFKEINDTQGHLTGDAVLSELAHRLQQKVVVPHVLARVGGDEFVVLGKNLSQEQRMAWASELVEVIQAPQQQMGLRFELRANLGIASFPEQADTAQQLLRHADIALFQAKNEDLPWQCYQATMGAAFARRSELFRRLTLAFEEQRLQVFYQPQVNLQDRRLIGAEALLRWNEPGMGWISPTEFIPVAEERGLIDAIGLWVLQQTCRQIVTWKAAGVLWAGRVAVNLSPHQFNQATIGKQVRQTLRQEGVGVQHIELEITESAAMKHSERSIAIINHWVQEGFTVAIDDFGTGYSSLASLKRFQAEILKIDQCFIRNLLQDPNDHAIVAATIAIAVSMGMKTLAEGVETEAQAAELIRMGCHYAQGFLYDRALPPTELEHRWLNTAAVVEQR